jgi:hypothetical protein
MFWNSNFAHIVQNKRKKEKLEKKLSKIELWITFTYLSKLEAICPKTFNNLNYALNCELFPKYIRITSLLNFNF